MKQLLILSGKGGTGKTTVAAALVELSRCRALADCDVDAPNLHLVTARLSEPQTTDYFGLQKAEIDPAKCVDCGLCETHCRFGAIHQRTVSPMECEGCGVCERICPVHAISMNDCASGRLMLYKDDGRTFSTAELFMGSGASGKLVTAVKQQLAQEASREPFAVIDGSPGIGCPVIASISGVGLVLMVAEPTVSGIHDLARIADTAAHFGARTAVCINKFDINPDNTQQIIRFCHDRSIPVVGKIPYDKTVVQAVNACRSIAGYPDSPAAKAIASMWDTLADGLLREIAG